MEGSGTEASEELHKEKASFVIPYDLFVTKKHKLELTDSFGNLVYKVQSQSDNLKLLLDSSSNSLFSIYHLNSGLWEGFKGNDNSKSVIFRAKRTLNELTRTEYKVFVGNENGDDSETGFKMIGSPFKRSCTIYNGDSILAESSLMYKLGFMKIFVPRTRFRVTLFPGFTDHDLLIALIVIFFNGRKFWI